MHVDLTRGDIKKQLLFISVPIIVTSFVRMLNNFIDMFWINKGLGDEAIAAIGIVGLLLWLTQSISAICESGTQVVYAQALGLKEIDRCEKIGKTGFRFNFYLSLIVVTLIISLSGSFLDLYNLDPNVKNMGYEYLIGVAIGLPFMYCNVIMSAVLYAKGHTKTTFIVNTIAISVNMVLDPVCIFLLGWGTFGAGLATGVSNIVAFLLFAKATDMEFFSLLPKVDIKELKKIVNVGLPNFYYAALFIFVSMCFSKVLASFGTSAVAVNQIGAQLESISWMTAGGFSVAISSFVGQNVGAKNYKRATKGVKVALSYGVILGAINTFIFFVFGEQIMSLFLQDPISIAIGTNFMRICSISQLFICIEVVAGGAFLGLAQSKYSATISAICTIIRLPLVMYLSREDVLGINGVWLTIVISCVLKGICMNVALFIYKKKKIDKPKLSIA